MYLVKLASLMLVLVNKQKPLKKLVIIIIIIIIIIVIVIVIVIVIIIIIIIIIIIHSFIHYYYYYYLLGDAVAGVKSEVIKPEPPDTTINTARLLVSCLHAWNLDNTLDKLVLVFILTIKQ